MLSAVRRKHERLLPTQYPRQHRDPARREGALQIARHQRQWARQDIRQDQIVFVPAQGTAAITGGAQEARSGGEAVAAGMMPRDAHSFRIDVASDDRATQALRGGNRQDAAAGPDIQWPAKAAVPRQSVQGKQAAAGGGMLAGAERRRRVDLNRN